MAIKRTSEQAVKEENAGLLAYIKKLELNAVTASTATRDKLVLVNSHTKTLLALANMEYRDKNFLIDGKQVNKLRTELLKEIDRLSHYLLTS